MNWDTYFFRMCEWISAKSRDPSTKVGCVVVGPDNEVRTTGFNGFPRGVDDLPDRYANRPVKYSMIVHAEANAIFHAARVGVALKGCTIYTMRPPCSVCAAGLIQSGISRVCCFEPSFDWLQSEKWGPDLILALALFSEAGVSVVYFKLGEGEEFIQSSPKSG